MYRLGMFLILTISVLCGLSKGKSDYDLYGNYDEIDGPSPVSLHHLSGIA